MKILDFFRKFSLFEFLKLPGTENLDIDDPRTTLARRQIIKHKKFLYFLYRDFYLQFLRNSRMVPPGPRIEIGSGAGFLNEIIPNVIQSDVFVTPGIDVVFSAEKLPFKKNDTAAFFMLDVLHHIPKPSNFLQEASACLKSKGRIIMIEPYISAWGKFIWKNFHHEPCDDKTDSWSVEKTGPLSGANSAIPWIIFVRDKEKFEKKFPSLRIVKIYPHTPFCYLLSGGVSMKTLVPEFTYGFFKTIELFLTPFRSYLSMFVTIVLEKR